MPEETTPEGEGETTPNSTDTPKQPINSIDRANDAINRMEAANKIALDIVERQEALKSEEILSGKADAGKEAEKPKEETDSEYTARALRGDFNETETKSE